MAIVAPIALQQEFLKLSGEKPVIMAVSDRVLVPDEKGGEDKVEFQFRKWEQLEEIKVVKRDFEGLSKEKQLDKPVENQNLDDVLKKYGYTKEEVLTHAVTEAVYNLDVDAIRKLVNEGAELSEKNLNIDEKSIIADVLMSQGDNDKKLELVKYLIEERSLDINQEYDVPGFDGYDEYQDFNTLIECAIQGNAAKVVDYLLNKGAELNKEEWLKEACKNNQKEIAACLVEHGADVKGYENYFDENGKLNKCLLNNHELKRIYLSDEVTAIKFSHEVAPKDMQLDDLSKAENYSIVGWADKNNTYHISTQNEDVILADKNCSKLFSSSDITDIDFSNFDVSEAIITDDMFDNCTNLKTITMSVDTFTYYLRRKSVSN